MQMPSIVTDRKARENFKDKLEVVMAVVVLTGFVHKKIKARGNSADVPNITDLPKENA